MAAFQSLGISDDTKERLNKLVIEVATILADNLERESPDCLAQLICRDSDFAALLLHLGEGEAGAWASCCSGC